MEAHNYVGDRDFVGVASVTVDGHPLDPRTDINNHGPGLEWGYGGSGPAQLALAILAYEYGDEKFAERWHQEFKRHVIAGLFRDQFILTSEEVRRKMDMVINLNRPK